MKKIDVEITEVLQKTITVDATDKKDAILKTKGLYSNEEVVLDSNDIIETKFDIFEDNCNKKDLKDFINEIRIFNAEREWDKFHTPANLAKSISIESSELLEHFQWNDENYNKEEVKEELADVMTYCIQMAIKLKVDILDILYSKLEKTKQKYPVDKSKGVSTKYNKL